MDILEQIYFTKLLLSLMPCRIKILAKPKLSYMFYFHNNRLKNIMEHFFSDDQEQALSPLPTNQEQVGVSVDPVFDDQPIRVAIDIDNKLYSIIVDFETGVYRFFDTELTMWQNK